MHVDLHVHVHVLHYECVGLFSPVTSDMALAEDIYPFQCATFNPVEPCLVATGNGRQGAALYDTRTKKKLVKERKRWGEGARKRDGGRERDGGSLQCW